MLCILGGEKTQMKPLVVLECLYEEEHGEIPRSEAPYLYYDTLFSSVGIKPMKDFVQEKYIRTIFYENKSGHNV